MTQRISLGILLLGLTACPRPHLPYLLECGYPGESYHNTFLLTSNCWSEGEITLVMSGKIPKTASVAADIAIQKGPQRVLHASVRDQGPCIVSLLDEASGVTCEFEAPVSADLREPVSCTKGGEPATCKMYLVTPSGYPVNPAP